MMLQLVDSSIIVSIFHDGDNYDSDINDVK